MYGHVSLRLVIYNVNILRVINLLEFSDLEFRGL